MAIRRAFKTLYKQNLPLKEALIQLSESEFTGVTVMADFINQSDRGIIR